MTYDKERIKELILTDYLDGQMSEAERKEIEAYIDRDPELKEFFAAAKKTVQQPFMHTENVYPPEHVWQNIKQRVTAGEQESEAGNILTTIWERLKELSPRPQLSFHFAAVMAVTVIALWAVTAQIRVTPMAYDSEQQVEYLMFLAEVSVETAEESNGGFDTTIEKYFL